MEMIVLWGGERHQIIKSRPRRIQIHTAPSEKTFWGAFGPFFVSAAVIPSSYFSSVPYDTHSTVFSLRRNQIPPFPHTSIISDQLASGSSYYPRFLVHTRRRFSNNTPDIPVSLFFSASAEGDVSYCANGQGEDSGLSFVSSIRPASISFSPPAGVTGFPPLTRSRCINIYHVQPPRKPNRWATLKNRDCYESIPTAVFSFRLKR